MAKAAFFAKIKVRGDEIKGETYKEPTNKEIADTIKGEVEWLFEQTLDNVEVTVDIEDTMDDK